MKPKLPPVFRPRSVEGDRLDDADVLASLAFRPPEEAQLDLRRRRVERPGRGSSELLTRVERQAPALGGDLEPAHDELPGRSGCTSSSKTSETSGHFGISPVNFRVQMILLSGAEKECIAAAGIVNDALPARAPASPGASNTGIVAKTFLSV